VAGRNLLKNRWGKPLDVKVVFFDIGGTLVHGDLAHLDLLHQALVVIGYKVTRDEVLEANDMARRAVSRRRRRIARRMDTSEASRMWLDHLAASLGLRINRDELEQELALAIRQIEARSHEVVDPEAPPLLETLRRRGLRLGVISNWSADLAEYLAQQGLADYFEAIVASEAVGSSKPHRQIFLHGLTVMGCEADRAVHVGDDYWADVVGARDIGIHPVLLDRDGEAVHSDCPTITRLRELEDLL
jgi:putative hydrolase of the HAD superfamily